MGKIKFTANPQKIVESVLYVLERKPDTTVYQMMKILFSADCYSLNTFGAPLTGDRYKIMPYGTVPETAYSMICDEPLAFSETTDDDTPFVREGTKKIVAKRNCNRALLSADAVAALEHGIAEYGFLSFGQIKEKNHAHKAYKNAEAKGRAYADFEDMIENDEVRSYYDEIGGLSENMVL